MSKGYIALIVLLCAILGEMTWSLAQQGSSTLSAQDYSDIQQLYAKYDFAIDSKNPEDFAGVFTQDGEFLQPGQSDNVGREALLNQIRRGMGQPVTATSIMRRHLNANLVVTPTAEGATGAVYLLAVNVNTRPPSLLGAYRYHDSLVKTAQGWRFKRRVVYADGLPEMSRLPPVAPAAAAAPAR